MPEGELILYTTVVDYDKTLEQSQVFFKKVQNKMLWADETDFAGLDWIVEIAQVWSHGDGND